jgi:long-chain acyl-CoA synthetase
LSVRTLVDLYRSGLRENRKVNAFLHRVSDRYVPVSSDLALERIQNLAGALVDAGVAPGDRVAIVSDTRLEWALADLAILTVAGITVPVFAHLPPAQIEPLLADSGAVLLFSGGHGRFEHIRAIWPQLSALRTVVLFDGRPSSDVDLGRVVPLADFEAAGARRLAIEPDAVEARARTVTPDHTASLIYTSGTTGSPKGVVLTHGNFVSNVLQSLEVLDLGPRDVMLSHLPLSHVLERMGGLFTPLRCGATIAYAESFERMPQNLLEVRPTVIISVPRFFERVLGRTQQKLAGLGSMGRALFAWAADVGRRWSWTRTAGSVPMRLQASRAIADFLIYRRLRAGFGGRIRFFISGGAPLNPETAHLFHAAGLPVLEGYGLTETAPVLAVNTLEHWRIGSVGRPLPGLEVRIADDGEILARGPNVMKGYYRRPEETAAAIDPEGWLHTGDIGSLDPDGYLAITDRKKDIIVLGGGKNVAPQPIEMLLRTIPVVSEVVVIGDGRPYLVALVVPDFPALEARARAAGIDFANRDELVADRRVRALVRHEIEARTKPLAAWERIRRFALLGRELTLAGAEVTPTLKVRRQKVAEGWADVIDRLYER